MSGHSSDSDHSTENAHHLPEEYHRILDQFRASSGWSPIHEEEEQQLENNLSDTVILDDEFLEAEYRAHFPDIEELVSPFRAPNIFDYQDASTETIPIAHPPRLANYQVISSYLNLDPNVGNADVEHYLATEPTVQNRNFERELQGLYHELQDLVARYQSLVVELTSTTSHEYQDTSVLYRYWYIQVLKDRTELAFDAMDAFVRYMRARGIEHCRRVLRGEITRTQANEWHTVYESFWETLFDHWMDQDRQHQAAQRLETFRPQFTPHVALTTLANIDTRFAEQTVSMPEAYTLTREAFLEQVEEHSSSYVFERDFQEQLRDLQAVEEEIRSRYQARLAEYIWTCGEIWEAVSNTQDAWDDFTELRDLELRERLLAGEMTIEQVQRVRDETEYHSDTLTIRYERAWRAYIEAKRLIGFNAIAQHVGTAANPGFLTIIMACLTRLYRIVSGTFEL